MSFLLYDGEWSFSSMTHPTICLPWGVCHGVCITACTCVCMRVHVCMCTSMCVTLTGCVLQCLLHLQCVCVYQCVYMCYSVESALPSHEMWKSGCCINPTSLLKSPKHFESLKAFHQFPIVIMMMILFPFFRRGG